MALKIRTTGKKVGPDEEPRLRTLIIGGPGAGKTRWSSYFPRPIYADCEDGTGSIWDRDLPVGEINSSQDMLDLLETLRLECMKPKDQRRYQTVVIDTLDAYQRKLKDEWVRANRAQSFTGWEAWGWLGGKLQTLMTRLLNLDMNVIVNVHYKDRGAPRDDADKETARFTLQLQGEIADTVFNDFDLVGWMGTYFEAEGGERVQKRGLTFRPTPDKPFLKDRLHITPKWLEVTFSDSDYTNLFSLLKDKFDSVSESRELEELPTASADVDLNNVVTPGQAKSAPASTAPTEMPLESLDKPTLVKMARDKGVQVRGNMLKTELVDAIKTADQTAKAAPTEATASPAEPTAPAAVSTLQPARSNPATKPAETVKGTESVNPTTGEITDVAPREDAAPVEPTQEQAIDTVVTQLGAKVFTDRGANVPAAKPAPTGDDLGECDDCHNEIPRSEVDYLKLSKIRYRAPKPNPVQNGLCKACFNARKTAA